MIKGKYHFKFAWIAKDEIVIAESQCQTEQGASPSFPGPCCVATVALHTVSVGSAYIALINDLEMNKPTPCEYGTAHFIFFAYSPGTLRIEIATTIFRAV